jgi:hypothetical protein
VLQGGQPCPPSGIIQGGQIRPPSNGSERTNSSDEGGQNRPTNPFKRTLKRGADANGADILRGADKKYAFEGSIVRITTAQLENWQRAYPDLPDVLAELQAADDYYSQRPPPDGKWFFPVSRWLKNENAKRVERRRAAERERDSW